MKKEGKQKKDVSINDLAVMVQKGFSEQGKKFTEFRGEMLDFKSEMIGFKSETEKTLFNIDSKLRTVDKRLDSIEKTLGPLVLVVDAMKINWRDHETRLLNLEKKVATLSD